jgi:diguanylate cyclase (GGDEF)-like protein
MWLAPLAVCVSLATLTVFRSLNPAAQQQHASQLHHAAEWLLVPVLVVGAWNCAPRLAIAAALLTLVAWSWLENRTSEGIDHLPVQLVRLIVLTGLVAWLLRTRAKLTAARLLARVDSLTGLPNRRAIIKALRAELSRVKRSGRPFSLVLFDCDRFKQINDRRGHAAGDDVLRRIGDSLRQHTRPYDCAGRWGGDEFLIVLPEADLDHARGIAERLSAAMRHDFEKEHPSLSFSLGVVTIHNADLDWPECVRQADEAMYAAKRLGQDPSRCEVTSE